MSFAWVIMVAVVGAAAAYFVNQLPALKGPVSGFALRASRRTRTSPKLWRVAIYSSVALLAVGATGFVALLNSSGPPKAASTDGTTNKIAGVRPSWGPDRQMFTMQFPAVKAAINSISDNPNYGDERPFLTVKEARPGCRTECPQPTQSWNIVPGNEYEFQIYINNSAADSLTSEALHDLRTHISLPQTIGSPDGSYGGQETATAFVSASNANPPAVWSTVVLSSPVSTTLSLKKGSVVLRSRAHPAGLPLPDSILLDSGISVGYKELDGELLPSMQYAIAVQLTVRAS